MKKNNIALYTRAIVFGFILWTSNLSASVVTYALTGVTTTNDGTLVSGYVVIDTELGQYDTISITADADPILGSPSETFYANPDLPFFASGSYSGVAGVPDSNYVLGLSLFPTGTSTFPETVALNNVFTTPFLFLYAQSGGGGNVSLQGSLTETPEPTTAYLMLVGALGLIGGKRFRRYCMERQQNQPSLTSH